MSQPVLLKVYGSLWPASAAILDRLAPVAARALPEQDCLELEDGLLRITFEGIWFPVEEIAEILKDVLLPEMEGKLDELDLEAWRMKRYIFKNGAVAMREAPLNNVLDYSLTPRQL